ncbi:hypothetical protein DFH08DRAFT_814529 [Mycena albidolilacea]|uniref:Uncharacterized protein n=1 Tax=Mycena albidolilacea TaxID=1033008 RepID=A0AAD7EK46_9AGAR|nr:hypothetical protein DFH08DRAFT_814529 [Mycena albidolilacea]
MRNPSRFTCVEAKKFNAIHIIFGRGISNPVCRPVALAIPKHRTPEVSNTTPESSRRLVHLYGGQKAERHSYHIRTQGIEPRLRAYHTRLVLNTECPRCPTPRPTHPLRPELRDPATKVQLNHLGMGMLSNSTPESLVGSDLRYRYPTHVHLRSGQTKKAGEYTTHSDAGNRIPYAGLINSIIPKYRTPVVSNTTPELFSCSCQRMPAVSNTTPDYLGRTEPSQTGFSAEPPTLVLNPSITQPSLSAAPPPLLLAAHAPQPRLRPTATARPSETHAAPPPSPSALRPRMRMRTLPLLPPRPLLPPHPHLTFFPVPQPLFIFSRAKILGRLHQPPRDPPKHVLHALARARGDAEVRGADGGGRDVGLGEPFRLVGAGGGGGGGEPLFTVERLVLVLALVLALVFALALALGSGVPSGTTPLARAGNTASTGDARSVAHSPNLKLLTLRPTTAVVDFGAAVWGSSPTRRWPDHQPDPDNVAVWKLPSTRAPHGKCCGYGRGESALLEGPASPAASPEQVSSGGRDLLLPSAPTPASTSADVDAAFVLPHPCALRTLPYHSRNPFAFAAYGESASDGAWRRSVEEAAELAADMRALAGVIVASETLRKSAVPARRAVTLRMPMHLRHTPGFAKRRLGAVPVLAGAEGAGRRVVPVSVEVAVEARAGAHLAPGLNPSEWNGEEEACCLALHNLTAGFQFGCRRELGAQIMVHKVQTRLSDADSVKQSEVRLNSEYHGGPTVMDRLCFLNFDSSTRSSGRIRKKNMTPLEYVNSSPKIRVN